MSVVFPQIFFYNEKKIIIRCFELYAWSLMSKNYIYYYISVINYFYLIYSLMKVVYPKNIKRGLLAGMTFSIGPLNVSVVQLFILALGVALALAVFNWFSKSWSKVIGLFLAIIILLIFIIIAFFKVSELWLLAYLAKLIRNNFFDAKKKFQVNYEKKNPIDVMIQESKTKEEKQIIEQKESTFDKQHVTDIEKKWLI